MPILPTQRNDTLRMYYTTSAGPGVLQPFPSASLGGFRSSTLALRPGFLVGGTMTGLRLTDVVLPQGRATLSVVAENTLSLMVHGQSGPGVPAPFPAVGTPRVVPAGDSGHVVASRVLPQSLAGTMDVTVFPAMGGALSMDDVLDADRQSGITTYRAVIIRNVNASRTAFHVRPWFRDNPGGLWSMAFEPMVGGQLQTIGEETEEPDYLDWQEPDDPSGDLEWPSLSPTSNVGLWFRRSVPAGDTATPRRTITIGLEFETQVVV